MSAKSAALLTALTFVMVSLFPTGTRADPPASTVPQRLLHAIVQNEVEVVKTLLAQGGDPNARVEPAAEDAWIQQGQTSDDPAPPLIVLACRFGSPGSEVVNLLIGKGADVNLADKNGVTSLMAASALDWDPSITVLLDHGAKVNVKDRNGKTALMYAMGNRGLGAVAKLLEHGAEINACDNACTTPLMYAITQAASDPIRLYGEDEAKRAARGKEAKARYLELIAFLLAHKADVNVTNSGGNTPLKMASSRGQSEVVQMLRQAGAKN